MSSQPELQRERQRILQEYAQRDHALASFYALHHPANLFTSHGRQRALLAALTRHQLLPLDSKTVLEVGCGTGAWLEVFQTFGAQEKNLFGIELDPQRTKACTRALPEARISNQDASSLPYESGYFDIVFQSMLFTSVLNDAMRVMIAREMMRVVKPSGAIIWYDFRFNNPRNSATRAIGLQEIKRLFPGCTYDVHSVTLAPPLSRIIVPRWWSLGSALEWLRVFNSHLLVVITNVKQRT